MRHKKALATSALTLLVLTAGCATPRTNGAVIPVQGGYQSVIKGSDRASAMRAFDQDAKASCGKSSPIPALATPGKYIVVSQSGNEKAAKAAKDIKSGDQRLDAAIAIKFPQQGEAGSFELTTVFRCEPLPNS